MLKATIVTRKCTSKKSIGKNKQSENNKAKSSNAQSCVASKWTTVAEGMKQLADV